MAKRKPSASVVRSYLSHMARLAEAMSRSSKNRSVIGDIMMRRRVLSSIERIYDLDMPDLALRW